MSEVRFKRGLEFVGVWSLTKMKNFGLRFACGVVLSSLTWTASATTTFAQCACAGSSQGIIYGGAESDSTILGQEALLDNVDNPAEMINFTVVVPEKAIVSFNGEPTFTKGSVRNYVVRGLKPGKTYKFDVTALLVNEFGAEYAAKEEVKVLAGETKQVVLQLRRQKRTPPPPAPLMPPPVAPAPAPAK